MLFAPSYMDLSVEAEAFGAKAVYSDEGVPTIVGKLIETEEDANALQIPEVGAGRTGQCIETVKKALKLITDRLERGEGLLGQLMSDDGEIGKQVNGLLKDGRDMLDDYRETSPVSTFSSIFFGAL